MDEYGIGSAAAMGLQLYESASRRSGRTTRMLAMATNDDVIVCRRAKESDRLRRLIKDSGKTTRVVTVEHSSELHRAFPPRAKGRAIFDHDWVHQFFVEAVRGAEDELKRMADSLSSVPADRKLDFAHPMNMQRRVRFGDLKECPRYGKGMPSQAICCTPARRGRLVK